MRFLPIPWGPVWVRSCSAPGVMQRRPGWVEAITATLRWAWRHEGPPPIDLEPREIG